MRVSNKLSFPGTSRVLLKTDQPVNNILKFNDFLTIQSSKSDIIKGKIVGHYGVKGQNNVEIFYPYNLLIYRNSLRPRDRKLKESVNLPK